MTGVLARAKPAWWADAACATPEVAALIRRGLVDFFPERGGSAGRARDVCAGCPVRQQCLDYALAQGPGLQGIFGGNDTEPTSPLARKARDGVRYSVRRFIPVERRLQGRWMVDAETGCWEWSGARSSNGYGQIIVDGRKRLAHRTVYSVLVAPVPADQVLCHRCDNPCCVNPEHLFVGTQKEDIADMHRKGRARGMFRRGPRGPIKHGTYGGYQAHQTRGIPVCGPCRLARIEYRRAERQRWRILAGRT